MAEPCDRTLVRRTRAGEVEAFGELVRRYQGAGAGDVSAARHWARPPSRWRA